MLAEKEMTTNIFRHNKMAAAKKKKKNPVQIVPD